jgi:hypothetical protein
MTNHEWTLFQRSPAEREKAAAARKRYRSAEWIRRWLRNYRFRERKYFW